MSRRNLYKHLCKNELIQGRNEPINDFTKPISQSEWLLLNNRNKRKYNSFAQANNLNVYAKAKKQDHKH
jgi:hypothetical protein